MYKWEIQTEFNQDETMLDQLLAGRGVVSSREKEIFLNPPPFSYWFQRLPKDLLRSLKKARDLINEAIDKEQAIVIHGDYDADGVCASAILYKALSGGLGYEHTYSFIPNRFDHGYGFSERSARAALDMIPGELEEKGVLFITVDCGITSTEEAKLVKEQGNKVIITDHHQKPENLPEADCIVWYDQVVGATVAYFLARVLGVSEDEFLAYCCIATVTDLQPVLDLNRTLVKEGLEIINKKPPLGIKNILDAAGKNKEEITTYDLGWLIGPRLNATGRVKDANYALNLLLEEDKEKSKKMAWELNRVNTIRQDKTMEMFELAKDLETGELPKVIISHHENYHEGIIGLVASRLSNKYHRPSVVISKTNDVYKGSVRSVRGVNVIEVLRELDEELFVSLGGHPMAAGFSLEKHKLDVFIDSMNEYAEKNIDQELLVKVLDIDMGIPAELLGMDLLEVVDKLRPFGMGNRQPVFCSYGLEIAGVNLVGKEQNHLALRLYAAGKIVRGIFFRFEDHIKDKFEAGETVDIAYNIKRNDYNGRVYVNLILKDIKKS